MTITDAARFLVITILGLLGVVTFLVAGTIVGLMIVEDAECRRCVTTPVGAWVMALLGALFIKEMVDEWSAIPPAAKEWYKANQTNVLISGIIIVVFILIFSW